MMAWLSSCPAQFGPQLVNVTNGSIIVEFLLRPRAHTESPLNWENIGAVISRGQQGHVLGLGYTGSLGSRYKVWRQAKENWQHFSSSIGSCFSDPFGSFAQDSRTAFELSMLLDKQLNSPYSALRRGPLGTGWHRDGKFKGSKQSSALMCWRQLHNEFI